MTPPSLKLSLLAKTILTALITLINAVYVRWCETTAWKHSDKLGLNISDYQKLDRAFAIIKAEYQYLAASYLGDELKLATWLTDYDGRMRMTRRFQIIRASDQAVILRGSWQMCVIQISTGNLKRMPQEFIDCYAPIIVET